MNREQILKDFLTKVGKHLVSEMRKEKNKLKAVTLIRS